MSENEEILEAEQIYVLMKKDFRLSRNTRAQWYFNNLDSVIHVSKHESIHDFRGELDVVSVIPRNPDPDWDWDIGHLYSYRVNSKSMVRFIAQRYRLVILLDLSPSSFGQTPVFSAFRRTLEALVRPFYVPGSQLLLKPDIYVTAIAWTPFLTDYTQIVLKQGFLLTSENLNSYLNSILSKLHSLSQRVSRIAASALNDIQTGRAESERLIGRIFEEDDDDDEEDEDFEETTGFKTPGFSIPVATPEAGFVNMVRTGILALQLLPKLSSGGIIVITDGIFSIPDMNICDSLLNQLRSSTISLSFLQVTSAYHPHTGYGRVPYVELMEFFSCATHGTYLPKVPVVKHESYVYKMNIFHEAFLCWSFRKALEGLKLHTPPKVKGDRNVNRKGVFHLGVNNPFFKNTNEEFLIKKQLLEDTMNCRLSSLLSVRLREGYTVNTVHISTQTIEVQLTLPWKIGTHIHYVIISPWPQPPGPTLPITHVSAYVEGCYDTLHDIICRKDKNHSSKERENVTRRFYVTLQNLAHVDKLLCHIESFRTCPSHYTIPEPISESVPLFYMPPNTTTPMFYREEFANTSFGSFWKPINSLDINIWHRWMHTNRIHIMLQHDDPLPRHLFLANSSGRYTSVQCRKAALKLFEMLKSISTFVLLENNSYIQFLKHEEDASSSPPFSFYMIRITSKPPCVVIWLAFPSGVSAIIRHRVHHQLLLKIDELRIKQNHLDMNAPVEVKGTLLLMKPVERILVRYNKIPQDYFNLFEPAYSNGGPAATSSFFFSIPPSTRNVNPLGQTSLCTRVMSSHGTFLALARYLHHKRWIWCIRGSDFLGKRHIGKKFLSSLISGPVLARILHTLAKSRLLEGFTFAHSHSGIQNLALELPMKHENKNTIIPKKSMFTQQCVAQYVIFPPYSAFYQNSRTKHSYWLSGSDNHLSEEEDLENKKEKDEETLGEMQIITEVWIEPQDGVVEDGKEERQYLNGLRYRELPDAIFERDKEIISTLITFEHLVSMCEEEYREIKENDKGEDRGDEAKEEPGSRSTPFFSQINKDPFSTVAYVPYSFDLITVLEKSSSVELLLSMFIQDIFAENSQLSPNEKFYDRIMDHIIRIHDVEYEMSENETIDFLSLILESDQHRRKKKNSWIHEDSYGKWRCFIKLFHNNHIIISLLPESFEELKKIMLDSSHEDDEDEEEEPNENNTTKYQVSGGVNFVKKPIEKQSLQSLLFDSSSGSSTSNLLGHQESSIIDSPRNNEKEEYGIRARVRSSGSDRASNQNRDRAGSLEAFYGGARSSTNDPYIRSRTFSMDSKFKSSSFLFRNRTNSCVSQQAPKAASTPKQVIDEIKKPAPSWGSLNLPIFMYDISASNLVSRLLKTKEAPKVVSSLIDNTFNNPERPAKKTGISEVPLVEKYIRNHAVSCQTAYYKAYVDVLFESLQNHLRVHVYDVNNGINCCDKEIFDSLDAKRFLDSVCTHGDIFERPCHSQNHLAIKKKFADILGTFFRLVPGYKDLYYFSSSFDQSAYSSSSIRYRRDTVNETDIEVASSLAKQLVDKRSSEVSTCIPSHHPRGDSSADSLMSNDSSNSNDTHDIDGISMASNVGCVPLGVPDEPLFLRVSTSLFKEENDGIYLSEMPTCWSEVIGKSEENLLETYSLNLLIMTVPPDTSTMSNASMCSSSTNIDFVGTPPSAEMKSLSAPIKVEKSQSQIEINSNLENGALSRLPELQKRALSTIVEDIRWMMEDEIVYSLTRSAIITESILKTASNHVSSSVKKPGCAVHNFPLYFVFRPKESLDLFISRFEKIDLQLGYKIISEEEFYYVVPDEEVIVMSSSNIEDHQRFQLSPVKEVVTTPLKQKNINESNAYKFTPNCWLIISIREEVVIIYFQYREGQLSTVLPWRQVLAIISSNIKVICKSVNQEMLLRDLNESRQCNRLLEPDAKEDSSLLWNSQIYYQRQQPATLHIQPADIRFKPGTFSCPVVWETSFCLHPRLNHFDHHVSRGVKAIRWRLNTFHVQNRPDMFVYTDEKGNIYYIMVFENAYGCYEKDLDDSRYVSRTSSFGSCAAKPITTSNLCIDTTSNISNASATVEQFVGSKIELKVRGLTEPGDDIKVDLVSALEHELNDQVVEVLSEILQRNPMSKLTPRDVSFLQAPDSKPGNVFSFQIPLNVSENVIVDYIKQNLINFNSKIPFICPKYSSSLKEHQFIDQETAYTFIYSKCGKIGRHRGIAVIKVECGSSLPLGRKDISSVSLVNLTKDDFLNVTRVSEVNDSALECRWISCSVWERGRLDMEKLKDILKQAVVQSLWDVNMELRFCNDPLYINGSLNPTFKITPDWLDYGISLSVASVMKFVFKRKINYSSIDILNEIRKTLCSFIVGLNCDTFYCEGANGAELVWCGDEDSCPELKEKSFYILIGKHNCSGENFKSNNGKDNDKRKSGSYGNYLKFKPSKNSPRSDLLLLRISRLEISLWAYNMSKEIFDQISKFISSSSHWLSARSSLTSSIVSQKLGLFHNQRFMQKAEAQEKPKPLFINPFLGVRNGVSYVEPLIKYKMTPTNLGQKRGQEQSSKHLGRFLTVYRDSKPLKPLNESSYCSESDLLKRHGKQMMEIKMADKKESLSRLYQLWQNRGESGSVVLFTGEVIKFFKSIARLVHFCLTPLLFLPHWRSQAHSTRLHILNPQDLSQHRKPQVEERRHLGLIHNYTQEYIQYLHTLGFIVVQRTRSSFRRNKSGASLSRTSSLRASFSEESTASSNQKKNERIGGGGGNSVYLQKSLPGGLLVFEIGVSQPFFSTKLYALEIERLVVNQQFRRDNNLGSGLVMSQEALKESFTQSLLEEIDHIKHLIHVHSFTYDYHLRTVHNFISGRPSNISKGFHVAHFIDDFIKYYNKGPNFARNMVHDGHISIKTPLVPPMQLYNYLLSHEKGYDLKVLRMEPLDAKASGDFECDYLLVRQSSSLTSQDQAESTNASSPSSGNNSNFGHDDYDFVLLLINDDDSGKDLDLRYYIILTSKRDLYPTYNVDKSEGQFRTVLKNDQVGKENEDNNKEELENDTSIVPENVNYVGYYSSREQSMIKVMSSMILATETMVNDIFERAMVHCRRDQLWSRLLNPSPEGGIQFQEFNELLTLVDIEPFEKINGELIPIVFRSIPWYQSLMKLMKNRYPISRIFGSPDGSVQHLVLRDGTHKNTDSCTLISIDHSTHETSINLIFKEQSDLESVRTVVENFLSVCLYHIWTGTF